MELRGFLQEQNSPMRDALHAIWRLEHSRTPVAQVAPGELVTAMALNHSYQQGVEAVFARLRHYADPAQVRQPTPSDEESEEWGYVKPE